MLLHELRVPTLPCWALLHIPTLPWAPQCPPSPAGPAGDTARLSQGPSWPWHCCQAPRDPGTPKGRVGQSLGCDPALPAPCHLPAAGTASRWPRGGWVGTEGDTGL